ncbi:hypothetical protein [Mycetocola sp. JXN-3]|uniref:hypothetical protein n=1 Tax=Mycetocola sp. JXN-3 TaxID=2116510 RepID=UPI00165CF15E|nr:hypothetical protein [Mycetocola sp. JXN-3]
MEDTDRFDAAIILTLVPSTQRPLSIGFLLSGWDMLDVDVPSRERVERAMAKLVGSGFAEIDPSTWDIRLTESSEELRRSVNTSGGMRAIPGRIHEALAGQRMGVAPLELVPEVFDAALEDYLARGQRRAERASRHRWWWPTSFRPRPAQRSHKKPQ